MRLNFTIILLMCVFLTGCLTSGQDRRPRTFVVPDVEAEWIRNGQPLVYEGRFWYPQDDVEVLQDDELFLIGDYKDVQIFVEKVDVRPFNRLYTKFANNKFRLFLREQRLKEKINSARKWNSD